jgi:hypothetical protein
VREPYEVIFWRNREVIREKEEYMKLKAIHYILIFVVSITLGLGIGTILGKQSGTQAKSEIASYLKGDVKFNNVEFLITNYENFNWTRVRFILNDKYYLETDVVAAGSSYTVGMAQFADKNGQRFNPFTMKPMTMHIRCVEGTIYGNLK